MPIEKSGGNAFQDSTEEAAGAGAGGGGLTAAQAAAIAANTNAMHDGASQDALIAALQNEQALQAIAIALNTLKVSADGSISTHSDVDIAGFVTGDLLAFNAAGVLVPSAPVVINSVTNVTAANIAPALKGAQPASAPLSPNVGDLHDSYAADFLTRWSWGGGPLWIEVYSVDLSTVSVPGSIVPLAPDDAAGSAGIANAYSREDHKHPLPPAVEPAAAISPVADDATGAVGTSDLYAREDHQHPTQGVSADADNSLLIGSDGLHYAPQSLAPDIVNGATGFFQIDEDRPAAPINIGTSTSIPTGFDLTAQTGMTLRVYIVDSVNPNLWAANDLDVDHMLERFAAGATADHYIHIHDNDFVSVNVIDPATGELSMTQAGRDVSYLRSELWITAPQVQPLFELANVGTVTTTGAFQTLGDPDPRITGADGDRVTLEYGSFDRDTFVFLGGVARAERKGGNASAIEFGVNDNQVHVRDLEGQSGILRAWYELHSVGLAVVQADLGNTEILRHRATAVNAGGQTAGNALFQIETGDDVTQLTDLITYSAGVVSGQYPYDIEIVADFRTLGTGAASRVYHFRDVLAGDAVGDVSGTSGVFGQGSAQTPARVTVPANTAFSYDVRSVSSEQNQAVQIGSGLYVTASDVSHEEAVTERLGRIPVADDQAISGYIDIGTMRMQWGLISVSSLATLTFPQPFGAVPVVTANAALNARIVSFNGTKTATQWVFSVRNNNNAGSTSDVYWQAIGIKP